MAYRWWDFWKLFSYAFTDDPIAKQDRRSLSGAGVLQPGPVPDIRTMSDGMGGASSVRLRDTNDFIDLSTVTNRMHRYREYDRLRGMAEIEMALTVIADEMCMSGDTEITTPAYEGGVRTLEWLVENKAGERFLVYSFDSDSGDYTLAWAYDPRLVGEREVLEILLDDGSRFRFTPDHRVMMKDESWRTVGSLKPGDRLMPFYRVEADQFRTRRQTNQFPRVFTYRKGWITERQFVDEWRLGEDIPRYSRINTVCQMVAAGLTNSKIAAAMGLASDTVKKMLSRYGFSNSEVKWLGNKPKHRSVIGVIPAGKEPVYDVSVEKHECVCTTWGVSHNCQRDEHGRVFKIECKNQAVVDELEYVLFHRRMLNLNHPTMWVRAKRLCAMGEDFWEPIIDPEDPKRGIVSIQFLPCDSMYRIETRRGRLVEFQQSDEGPDYQSLNKVDVTQATDAELNTATAIRFTPEQIIHIRLTDDRKTFYPYGMSIIEPARGPAHQLRLMEDAMIIYRLTRAPERRVFYIDTMNIPPHKVEAYMERQKDLLKKQKAPRSNSPDGASAVEERWHALSPDEDFFIPTKANSNTRIETLPGAQNLGEIDDTVYFRQKLFQALGFPRGYAGNDDPQVTRMGPSQLDISFARMIERLQGHMAEGIWELCDRHLRLRGFPEEDYEDLAIKMTTPSDYFEITRQEITSNRLGWAGQLKGNQLMSDFDILTKWLKYSEEDAKIMLARLKLQKIEELQMQIVAQNPSLTGVGLPPDDESQVSSEATPENPMLGGTPGQPPMPPGGGPPPGGAEPPMPPGGGPPSVQPGKPKARIGLSQIPEPSDEDVHRYDMGIEDYASEQDTEEVDRSEDS